MSRSKIIILTAAAVVLLALATAVFYFGFIGDVAKLLRNPFTGDAAKAEKRLSPDEVQQADLSSQKDIFDPAYFIPELGRTYKYSFIDDGERHEIIVEWSKENGVYTEYSDYPSFSFFSENKYELAGGKLVIPQEIHGWYESEYLVTDYEGEYVSTVCKNLIIWAQNVVDFAWQGSIMQLKPGLCNIQCPSEQILI